MSRTSPRRPLATVLVAASTLVACQCSNPSRLDERDMKGSAANGESSSTGSSTSDEEAGSEATAEPVDVERLLGVFHYESPFIPFGEQAPNSGDAMVANLEIRPDGTASMSLETCNTSQAPLLIDWRWEARPGPSLELSPGPGEASLRFMALAELESVTVMPGEACALVIDAKGEEAWVIDEFHPGRACWVDRCETWNNVHIDYCDGQAPPPCK